MCIVTYKYRDKLRTAPTNYIIKDKILDDKSPFMAKKKNKARSTILKNAFELLSDVRNSGFMLLNFKYCKYHF